MNKKLILKIIAGIVILAIIDFGYNLYKTIKWSDTHFDIKEGRVENITLVNIGEGDREYIANLINEIGKYHPKIIFSDTFFEKLKDEYKDSLLVNALKNNNVLVGIKDKKSTHQKFLNVVDAYGSAVLQLDDDGYSSFFYPISGNTKHISVVIAEKYAPLKAKEFLEKNKQKTAIKFSRLGKQFKKYEYKDLNFKRSDIENKIVMLGYLGPTDEDKHDTYLRYQMDDDLDPNAKDTYGLVIVANQVLMIIDED